jgi:hypothetical protein
VTLGLCSASRRLVTAWRNRSGPRVARQT